VAVAVADAEVNKIQAVDAVDNPPPKEPQAAPAEQRAAARGDKDIRNW
jgi:hypothetical protein